MRTCILAVVAFVGTLVVPSPSLAQQGDDLSAMCAAAFAVVARAENTEGQVTGNKVVFTRIEVRLDAQLEAVEQKDDYWFFGLAVTASCSNAVGSSLSAGIVSVGRTRADTLDAAAKEWAMFSGAAIVRGCVLKERSRERYRAGGFDIYPGPLAIRGQLIQFGKDDHARLLDHLLPVLQNLASDGLHSVALLTVRNADGSIDGEARLDGSVSNTLFEAAKTFAWPKTDASYLFKQYYVLERTR